MDLAAIDTAELANAGAVLEVRAPNGSPALQDDNTPVTITLLGDDSDVLTRINNAHGNEFIRNMKPGAGGHTTVELGLTKAINKLAKATVAWSGIVVDGEELKCTEENAKAVYRRFPWLREQVRTFIEDRANFTKASPTS